MPFLAGISVDFADVSRDGQWVAYSDFGGALWRCRPDGSQAMQLTFPPMGLQLPRWSPDGTHIAFLARKSSQDRWQAYVIPAGGGECQPVLPAAYLQGAPTWSPDGAQVAFGELQADATRSATEMRIHVVNLRTHEATTVPGSAGLWTARWSPDGRYIAAMTSDSKSLMVFDFHKQQWEKIATASGITDLNWSHHSDWIYFTDLLPPNGPAIFRVRLRGRRVEEVTSLKRDPPIFSVWLGLTPDDFILVSNAADRTEVYSLDWEAL